MVKGMDIFFEINVGRSEVSDSKGKGVDRGIGEGLGELSFLVMLLFIFVLFSWGGFYFC